MNEFKFSALRQFGSENVSFTATIQSEKQTLSDEEIQSQVDQIGKSITKAFVACTEREISEKDILAATADRRRAGIMKLDQALKDEMVEKVKAEGTIREAEKLSKKLNK